MRAQLVLPAVLLAASCAPVLSPAQVKAIGDYRADLESCAQNAQTMPEYQACADRVDARYGVKK